MATRRIRWDNGGFGPLGQVQLRQFQQFISGRSFGRDQSVVSMRERSYEFVKFALHGDLLVVLCVLQYEHHEQCHTGTHGIERCLPPDREACHETNEGPKGHYDGYEDTKAGFGGGASQPSKESAHDLRRCVGERFTLVL